MIEGAVILAAGIFIGFVFALHQPRKTDDVYDKYRNKDGLYSRRAVLEEQKAQKKQVM